MIYFVTGATGFIGKRLVRKLLERPASTVYFLTREASQARVPDLLDYWGVDASRAIPVVGDLTAKDLGIGAAERKKLKGKIRHLFHLAAVYDLKAGEQEQQQLSLIHI